MNVLNPAALLFALIAIPIILLYLLRLQRREQIVSSTLLWRQATLDREANTLWQRLRKNLLLFLQLLTLAFFVFALVRPYINVPSSIRGTAVVYLDASASMRAVENGRTRFDLARDEAYNLVRQLGADDRMIIVLVDGAPRALTALTSDKALLNEALAGAQPTLSGANWSAAVALAGASVANTPDVSSFVISDGAGLAAGGDAPAESGAAALRLISGAAAFIPIGASSDNVALSALTLRRTLSGLAAFVRVTNFGAQPDSVLVAIRADGALIDARQLDIAPGQSGEFTVSGLSDQTVSVEARIDQAARNALSSDDVAYAVNAANATRSVLLLTNGNRFLEQALAALPGIRVTRAVSVPLDAPPYDLYVLDRIGMPLPPRANVLGIGAESLLVTGVISSSGAFTGTEYLRTETHPVTRQTDWRTVNVLSAQRINAPAWLLPLVESRDGPLLYAGENFESGGLRRVVLVPFELRRSDLPLQIAFPILIANSVDWLAPPQGVDVPDQVRPGDVAPLPEGSEVTLPDGSVQRVDARGFAQTTQAGVYRFKTPANAPGESPLGGAFAVNFINPAESDITPSRDVRLGAQPGAAPAPAAQGTAQQELWRWLAAAALLLLIAEWWIFQRGMPALGRKS